MDIHRPRLLAWILLAGCSRPAEEAAPNPTVARAAETAREAEPETAREAEPVSGATLQERLTSLPLGKTRVLRLSGTLVSVAPLGPAARPPLVPIQPGPDSLWPLDADPRYLLVVHVGEAATEDEPLAPAVGKLRLAIHSPARTFAGEPPAAGARIRFRLHAERTAQGVALSRLAIDR
jgi:hypothetical protein